MASLGGIEDKSGSSRVAGNGQPGCAATANALAFRSTERNVRWIVAEDIVHDHRGTREFSALIEQYSKLTGATEAIVSLLPEDGPKFRANPHLYIATLALFRAHWHIDAQLATLAVDLCDVPETETAYAPILKTADALAAIALDTISIRERLEKLLTQSAALMQP